MTTDQPRYRQEAGHIINLIDEKIEELKDELPSAASENTAPGGKSAEGTDVWRNPSETEDSTASGDVLRQEEEERETGRVAFKVYKEYFLYGASATVLFIIAMVFFSGQGKRAHFHISSDGLM